jgi:hypothetical protein
MKKPWKILLCSSFKVLPHGFIYSFQTCFKKPLPMNTQSHLANQSGSQTHTPYVQDTNS